MEHPIPTLDGYTLTDDCQVISYRRTKNGKGRVLTPVFNRPFNYSNRLETVFCLRVNNKSVNIRLPRIILAVKLGRWPESWEHARHIDGDWTNNTMDNIEVGCALLNVIDDLELGTRKTTVENISEAVARLEQLKATLIG